MTDMVERRAQESTLVVKWWGVLILATTVIGWLSVMAITNAGNIKVLQSDISYLSRDVTEIKTISKEIRQDQLRRYQQEVTAK